MASVTLMHGDCLDLMREIPDGSVDMILCDLPYAVLDVEWDKRINGEKLFYEYKRVCKQNANVLLFCQMAFAQYLMNSTFSHEFSHCLVWVKENKTRCKSAKHLPMSQYEMVLCFRINKYKNTNDHKELREYFLQELSKSGLSVAEIEDTIPNRSAHHWFRQSSDYRIPTKQNYERLQQITGRFTRPYSAVRAEFFEEKNNTCTFNRGFVDSDVLYSRVTETRVHPTQKPVELLERLLRAYSNEGDTVLDNTMGSGSTGVACVNTGRNFIGIELDDGYFDIAQKRINEAASNPRLAIY